MNKLNFNLLQDQRIAQIIDANLDRAREGLRVMEDWARFALGRKDLVKEIKNYRQILGKHHLISYKESRNFNTDECTGLAHPEQFKRNKAEDIISTNAARVQEALRVIEEFSRNHNEELCILASNIRYQIYDLEIQLIKVRMNDKSLKTLRKNNLYFITTESDNLFTKIEQILEGGVRIVQARLKGGNDSDNLKLAMKIKALCKKHRSLFIINDRIDIAYACDADGVHLGQKDLDIKSARKILGFSKIIGASANNEKDINNMIEEGCDYLGIGPVFETALKKDKKPIGLEDLKKLTRDIMIPWFAIGGIKAENIESLKKINIKKVAMISELINSDNPKETAKMIINCLSNEN